MVPAGLDYVDSNYTPGPGPVVLPAEKYGVSDVMEMTNQRINQWSQNKQAEQKEKRGQLRKMLEGLEVDTKDILDKDVPEFVQGKKQLEQFYTNAIANGSDPDNANFLTEYQQARTMKGDLETKAQGSKQHKQTILQAQKDIDAMYRAGKGDLLDMDATLKEIATYHDKPLAERNNHNTPLLKFKTFDGDEYMREDLFGSKSPFKPGKVSEIKKDPNNPSLTYVEEVEGRNHDQVMQATRYALDSKPEFRDWIYSKFEKMKEEHPEAYAGYVAQAQAMSNDGTPVTADEVFASQKADFAYNEATKNFEYQRESNKNLKYDPKDTIAFKAGIAAQERNKVGGSIYEKWKAFWTGDSKQWYKGGDGKLHSSVWNGNQWGSPYVDPIAGNVTATVLDSYQGGKDGNGNNIIMFKTTKSAKENPANPYFPVTEMSQAMDQWIIGGSGELTNPGKATDIIQGTRVYGQKDGTYNPKTGTFTMPTQKTTYTSPEATAAYQNVSVKQQKIAELETKLSKTSSRIPEYAAINTELQALKKEKEAAKQEFISKHVHNVKTVEEAQKLGPGAYWSMDGGKTFKKNK